MDKKTIIKLILAEHNEGLRFKDIENELTKRFPRLMSRPTLSKHLKEMEKKREIIRMVYPEKEGIYYKLVDMTYKRAKILVEFVDRGACRLAYKLYEKYKIEPITALSFGLGFSIVAIFQAIQRKTNYIDETILMSFLVRTIEEVSKELMKRGEWLIDAEVEKDIEEILTCSKERLDEISEEIKEEREEFLEFMEKYYKVKSKNIKN